MSLTGSLTGLEISGPMPGRQTFERNVKEYYAARNEQRQEAFNHQWGGQEEGQRAHFERKWQRREAEWIEQANELQNHIHREYKRREEMRAAGLQGQEGGKANMEKLKCPSLGDEDPDKDAKLTSKEHLVWRKGVELWRIAGGVPSHKMGP